MFVTLVITSSVCLPYFILNSLWSQICFTIVSDKPYPSTPFQSLCSDLWWVYLARLSYISQSILISTFLIKENYSEDPVSRVGGRKDGCRCLAANSHCCFWPADLPPWCGAQDRVRGMWERFIFLRRISGFYSIFLSQISEVTRIDTGFTPCCGISDCSESSPPVCPHADSKLQPPTWQQHMCPIDSASLAEPSLSQGTLCFPLWLI